MDDSKTLNANSTINSSDAEYSGSSRIRPARSHNSNRKFIIAIIVLAILALGGVGFGVYGMIKLNNADNRSSGTRETATVVSNQEIIETVEGRSSLK